MTAPVSPSQPRLTAARQDAPMNAEPRLALWCHANPDQAADRIEELEAALRKIMQTDQIMSQRLVDVDAAGNTYAIVPVDGTCAAIARAALTQSSTPARG